MLLYKNVKKKLGEYKMAQNVNCLRSMTGLHLTL